MPELPPPPPGYGPAVKKDLPGPPAGYGAPPSPLSEAAVGPTQVTGVKSDREAIADLLEGGIDIGATLLPGVPQMGLLRRTGAMGLAGMASPVAKEATRRQLGLPPQDPNDVMRDVVIHGGLNALAEFGFGSLAKGVGKIPEAYRWSRGVLPGGAAYKIKLADAAARQAENEAVVATAREFGLPLSAGKATGKKSLQGIEAFGTNVVGGKMLLEDVDKAFVGEVANASRSIMDSFAPAQGQRVAGQKFQDLMKVIDEKVGQITDKAHLQLDAMTGGAKIVNLGPEGQKAVIELNKRAWEIESAGYSEIMKKSARRQEIEKSFFVGEPLTFEAAGTLRSKLLWMKRNLSPDEKDLLPLVNKILPAVDKSMEQAARSQGGNVETLWRETNKFYREWAGPFQRGVINKMVTAAPEDVARLIKPDDPSAFKEVHDAIFNFVGSTARKQNRWDAFRRSWVQEQLRGAQEATGEEPAKVMASQILKLDQTFKGPGADIAKNYFMSDPAGKQLVTNVGRLADVMRRYEDKAPGMGLHGWIAIHGIMTGVAGAAGVTGRPGIVATVAAVETLPAVFTKILRSRTATDYFVKGFTEAFPVGGKVGTYLKPSAMANIFRAIKAADTENNILPENFYDAWPVKPKPLPAPGE